MQRVERWSSERGNGRPRPRVHETLQPDARRGTHGTDSDGSDEVALRASLRSS